MNYVTSLGVLFYKFSAFFLKKVTKVKMRETVCLLLLSRNFHYISYTAYDLLLLHTFHKLFTLLAFS